MRKKCEERISARSSNNRIKPKTYAAWSKTEDTRFNSTSGGVFSELAREVLRKGGYVAGAGYSDNNEVKHFLIHTENELWKLRQSKYTQSNSERVFCEVKEHLLNGDIVLFCGTPCQVSALYAYLPVGALDRLYTVDFICRGVNSPKAYRAWLNEIENQHNALVDRVWFKYKVGGWKSSPKRTRLDFSDGKVLVLEGTNNAYMHGYLSSNLYIRPSCGSCDFKGVPRKSDITLADFWGISEEYDDDKGTSLVLVNNERGERLFNDIKDEIIMSERSFDEILKGNVCFGKSIIVSPNADAFLAELDRLPFSKALKKFTRESIIKRIFRKVRNYVKNRDAH